MNKKLITSLILISLFIHAQEDADQPTSTRKMPPGLELSQESEQPMEEIQAPAEQYVVPVVPTEDMKTVQDELLEESIKVDEQIPEEVPAPEAMKMIENENIRNQVKDFEEEEFDHEAKRKTIMRLVDRGVEYFKKNTVSDTCNKFTHTKEFIEGELYLFLFDFKGTTFAHGQQSDLVWKNLYNLRDSFGTFIVQEILKKAKAGGGWVTYEWREAGKVSYVREIRKDGKSYAIGCGYYPHSKRDAVITLVKSAVSHFNKIIKSGGLAEDGFSPLSYPVGRFIYGDLYLYAFDFKGNMVAQGDRPGLIGTNAWDYKDATGKLVNQEIVNKLKEKDFGEGVWVDYTSKRALKMAYAEKIADAKGNNYVIACGYYPEANRKAVVELVKRGYQYMKTHGKTNAARDFTDVRNNDYRFGDLFLVVYDMKGNVIAQGGNPEYVGKNQYNSRDEDGRYYVRDIIQKAKEGGGWLNIKLNKSFLSAYYEKVDLGVEEFVIGSGVYPVSKHETMILLAKSGADFLENNEPEVAFQEFVKPRGKFIRGDITLFSFDMSGVCYTYGDDYNLIWRNLMNVTDDNGKPFVRDFINMVKHGFGTTEYTLNGAKKVAYIESRQKGDMTYIVGSSYYQ